jgi:biopolymer transport protein ExbD
MKRRQSREPKRGRIEIIPMIDVMFFLLATFMLATLSMQNLNALPVNLPQGQAEKLNENAPITLTITNDGSLRIERTPVTLDTLADTLKPLLRNQPQKQQQDIIVSADTQAPQGVVVQAMLRARAAGVQHFLIAVKHE